LTGATSRHTGGSLGTLSDKIGTTIRITVGNLKEEEQAICVIDLLPFEQTLHEHLAHVCGGHIGQRGERPVNRGNVAINNLTPEANSLLHLSN